MAEEKKGETIEKKTQEEISKQADMITKLLPAGQDIAVGAIFGYCAGYFSRSLAKYAIFLAGGAFVVLQLLQSAEIVQVNWKKIEDKTKGALDLNNDGKIDAQDVNIAYKRYLSTLTAKVPSTAGFAAAFFLGFRGKFLK